MNVIDRRPYTPPHHGESFLNRDTQSEHLPYVPRLILIRHEQTIGNKSGIFLKDPVLTAEGIHAAYAAAETFWHTHNPTDSVLIHSGTGRTRQMSKIYQEVAGGYVSTYKDHRFREREWGAFDGKSLDQIIQDYPKLYGKLTVEQLTDLRDKFGYALVWKILGSLEKGDLEPIETKMKTRIAAGLADCNRLYEPEINKIIFSHAGPIKLILHEYESMVGLTDLDRAEYMSKNPVENGQIIHMDQRIHKPRIRRDLRRAA